LSDNEIKDYQGKKAIVNAAIQWNDLRLSEQIKHLRFFRDKDNNIVAMPVVMFDPTQTGLNVLPMGRVGISDPTALNAYARVFGLPCSGWPETTLGLVTHSTEMLQRTVNLEAHNTPTIFRSAGPIVNAGPSADIWVPTIAGNRIHLMGGSIILSVGATTAAAALVLQLYIGGAPLAGVLFCVSNAALAATTGVTIFTFAFQGNGYRMAAINNALAINLSAALTAGCVTVNLYGYEEVG